MKTKIWSIFGLVAFVIAPFAWADGEGGGEAQQPTIPSPDPAVAEFARGVKFTVNGYNGGAEVQTNFPVLVRLSTAITGFDYGDFYNANANPTDPDALRLVDVGFVDAEGNGLAYDIDTWNTNDESLVWVNLPRMTNGTEFAMWYRSSKTGKALNPDNVWTNYAGVWHFREDYGTETGSVDVYDSTTNGLTGSTLYNATTKGASVSGGRVGRGRRMGDNIADGNKGTGGIDVGLGASDSPKRAAVDRLASPAPAFSTSFWIYPEMKVRYPYYVSRKNADTYPAWAVQSNDNKADKANAFRIFSRGTASDKNLGIGNVNAAQNAWTKIDVVYTDEGTTGKAYFYVNGVLKNSGGGNLNTGKAANGSVDFYIGGGSGGDCRPFGGIMDEVRLCYNVPSAARVKADFDTVNTASFLIADMVVTNQITERPVVNFTVADTGASHIQFGGTLSSLGSDDATECTFYGKVWKTSGNEPSEWTTFASGLTGGALSGLAKGLDPATAYSYKLKVTNDEDVDSDEASGSFTTSGVAISGTGGDITHVGDDWIHYFRVGFDEEGGLTNAYVFTPPSYASTVQALVVAGGGPGGYRAGGGGGAGGLYYNAALGVTPGAAYTINVGTGGVASASSSAYGSNGGNSSIYLAETKKVETVGGGAGGNGTSASAAGVRSGRAGGSGGGSSHKDYSGGAASDSEGQGSSGGKGNSNWLAGGGGGALSEGGSALDSGDFRNCGSGGGGFECYISGVATFYAGGGGGGGDQFVDKPGTPGPGGNGGGGTGSRRDADGVSYEAEKGVDGLGGGGGGGNGDVEAYYQGGDGGDGIVIIRYVAQGDGDDIVNPMISLAHLAYDGLSGNATATYRVVWAGKGHEDADVYAIWGFDPENLDQTNHVANAMIGNGSNPFELPPLSKKTVYIRLLAKNAGNYTGISPEILSIELYNPCAPEATVSLASAVCTNAVFTVDVTSLGQDATNATVSIQVARDLAFTSDVLSFPNQTTVTAVGAAAASAWGLDTNTTYYARSVVSNDIHQVYETDPIAFETLVPGSPQGTVSNGDPGYTTFSALATTTDFGVGSGSMAMRLEVSTAADFATFDSLTPWLDATVGRQETLTATGLVPDTTYHARVCFSNWWGRVTYLPLVDTATRSFPFASSGLAFSAGAGDTVDFSFPVTALYDGATVAATLSYAGTEIGTESTNAAPATLSWSGVAAAAETATATVVATATLPGGETIEKTWTVSVAPGSSVSVVANVAAHASAVDALWMRPGEVVLLPPVAGVGFYQVLNPRFATVEGNTLTALEPGIVGVRCVDACAVTNIMGVVVLPDAIGSGKVYVYDETKVQGANNENAYNWSNPTCWVNAADRTSVDCPTNTDDIAVLPFYTRTGSQYIRHFTDITIGGLYAGMIRPDVVGECIVERYKYTDASNQTEATAPHTVTFRRTDGQPVRVQVCPNGFNSDYQSQLRFGGYRIDVVWASDAVIDCGSSETDHTSGPVGTFMAKNAEDNHTLQNVTLTIQGLPGRYIEGTACTREFKGALKGTGTIVRKGQGGIAFNGDIGGFSGSFVLRGAKTPGGIAKQATQLSIRGGGATNVSATVYGVVSINTSNGSLTTGNAVGLFGTSAQVKAAPPGRGPDAPAKGLSLFGGSWYAGRIDNNSWGVGVCDNKVLDELHVGAGCSFISMQGANGNNNGYPINVITARSLRQTERGTFAVNEATRQNNTPPAVTNSLFFVDNWADLAIGADGNSFTSSIHPVIPWMISPMNGDWSNVAFASFDEDGQLLYETRDNCQITQAPSEDANLYMTGKNLNYGSAGGDYTINSLYISNGDKNRWLGEGRTLRIKSGGLILQGKSAIGLPGRTDNGALILGDATHPAYVWAKGFNADTNYLGAAVTAAGGFVSAYPGNLCLVGDQTGIADEIAVNGGTLAIGTADADCSLAVGIPIRVCTGAKLLLPTVTNAVAASSIKLDGAGKNSAKVILPVNQTCASLAVRDVYESDEWTTLPSGTYGSSESAAEFVRDDLFVGPGVLRVGAAPTPNGVMFLVY